jgi:hypothetical protein
MDDRDIETPSLAETTTTPSSLVSPTADTPAAVVSTTGAPLGSTVPQGATPVAVVACGFAIALAAMTRRRRGIWLFARRFWAALALVLSLMAWRFPGHANANPLLAQLLLALRRAVSTGQCDDGSGGRVTAAVGGGSGGGGCGGGGGVAAAAVAVGGGGSGDTIAADESRGGETPSPVLHARCAEREHIDAAMTELRFLDSLGPPQVNACTARAAPARTHVRMFACEQTHRRLR